MKRKSSSTAWQLRLFDGLDADVLVLQRDEQEVYDDAIHVFLEKEYYDAYVNKARKYSDHDYAYHEDKLGEVIYQILEENIGGLVIHIPYDGEYTKGVLYREKYLSNKELRVIEDTINAYHYLYKVSIDRMEKEEALSKLWAQDVFIIGQMGPTVEFMTIKRKNDGQPIGEDGQYDYESIKLFLTYESAMRYNPENKVVNKYKLGMITSMIRGHVKAYIEPHRAYGLEYDPETLDLSKYYHAPAWNDESVANRIKDFVNLDKHYILLSAMNSDYIKCVGTPFIIKENGETMMFIFENYNDAVRFCNRHQQQLPAFGGTYPIGVLSNDQKIANFHTVTAICKELGVYSLFIDNETPAGLCFKMPYFFEKAGLSSELETFMPEEDWKQVKHFDEDGTAKYNLPLVPFADKEDEFAVSDEKKEEINNILNSEELIIKAYLAGTTVTESMYALSEVSRRFDLARKAGDTITMSNLGGLLNTLTTPIVENLYDMPYIFTLRNEEKEFVKNKDLPYLLVTNRYESGRKGEGIPYPVRIDNEEFMTELENVSKIAILTDGPNSLCLADVNKLAGRAKELKSEEPVHEEMMIYMTEGCGLQYDEAKIRLKRIKSDASLYNEFVSNVRNGGFSQYGSIEVAGVTAQELSEDKNMTMLEAYEKLLELEIEAIEKANGSEKDENEEDSSASGEKTGFFGKFFKK